MPDTSPSPAPAAAPPAPAAQPAAEKPNGAAPPPKPETPAERKHRLPINGKERELTEPEMREAAQKWLGGDDRFTAAQKEKMEAQRLKAETDAKEARLKPGQGRAIFKYLQDIGWSREEIRKASEDELIEAYKAELGPDGKPLTEEQKELARLREAEAQRKEAEKAKAEEEKSTKAKALEAQHRNSYGDAFAKALDKLGTKGPAALLAAKRLAMLEEANLHAQANGHPARNVDELAKQEADIFASEVQTRVGALEGDALLSALGDGLVKKVLRAAVARGKGPAAAPKATEKPRNSAGQFVPREERDTVRFLQPVHPVRDMGGLK